MRARSGRPRIGHGRITSIPARKRASFLPRAASISPYADTTRCARVAGIELKKAHRLTLSASLYLAILGECGLALDKQQSDAARQAIALKAQQEQLRANLLRAISHDLRTPLTSISGNADMLLRGAVPEEEQLQLYGSIYDDSIWLINLVENLLSHHAHGRQLDSPESQAGAGLRCDR